MYINSVDMQYDGMEINFYKIRWLSLCVHNVKCKTLFLGIVFLL